MHMIKFFNVYLACPLKKKGAYMKVPTFSWAATNVRMSSYCLTWLIRTPIYTWNQIARRIIRFVQAKKLDPSL